MKIDKGEITITLDADERRLLSVALCVAHDVANDAVRRGIDVPDVLVKAGCDFGEHTRPLRDVAKLASFVREILDEI